MTSSYWDDDRLNALATQVAGLGLNQGRIDDDLAAIAAQQRINTANIADITLAVGALIANAEIQQQETRGLQVEVRRLVEELRRRRED